MQIGVEANRAVENRRIFVIDDDDVSRIALQFMLADENETHEMDSLEAATIKAADYPPDLILVGTGLLEKHGASMVARIKTLFGASKAVKVVMIASGAEDAQIPQGMQQGADGYITKPLKLEAVRRKVDLQLGRQVSIGIPVV